MRTLRAAAVYLVLTAASLGAQTAAQTRVYAGQEAAIEACLRTTDIAKYQDISLGVTRPTRAWLAPGALVSSVAWKPLRPGVYRGFYESYKSEIAAYRMDRLLDLRMVPPAVERKLNGITGAVIMWIDNTRMWRDLGSRKPVTREWSAQMVRMKMFDALIGNIDRNAGNILVDENWTVYLIDHSRAFVAYKEPPAAFAQVDASLWARMKALDATRLHEALGPWVERRCIDAILARRDRMEKAIAKLIAKRGESLVYVHE
ncbi:MAG: hypothetical protein HYU53_01760 [Acidobacteria bacterium]|nr:hypothetical protein [Acidobacteriota bacterium]